MSVNARTPRHPLNIKTPTTKHPAAPVKSVVSPAFSEPLAKAANGNQNNCMEQTVANRCLPVGCMTLASRRSLSPCAPKEPAATPRKPSTAPKHKTI